MERYHVLGQRMHASTARMHGVYTEQIQNYFSILF